LRWNKHHRFLPRLNHAAHKRFFPQICPRRIEIKIAAQEISETNR